MLSIYTMMLLWKIRNIEIVVIEDEADILELLEYHLAKEGYM